MRYPVVPMLLLAALAARPALGANACKTACKTTKASCLTASATTYAAARAVCRSLPDPSARKACLKAARSARASANAACKASFRTCKSACAGGGGSGACGSHAGGWLATVNAYRALAGLGAVTEDPTFSAGDLEHAQYMVQNDVIGHSEDAGLPGYTDDGNLAASKSNVGLSSNPAQTEGEAVDLWMEGPYHAIGILDPRLQTSGFGIAHDSAGSYHTGSALDVIRGLTGSTSGVAFPVLFPGDGGAIPLDRYTGGESPDPLATCSGYTTPTGPPLIVQFATTPVVEAHDLLRDGTAVEHCVFAPTGSSDPLGARHAVVIMPRAPLQKGSTYQASLTVGGTPTTWSFTLGCP